MRTISASEAKQKFAALLDAAQREPVVIRRHDRDVAVLVSPQDYERLRAVRIADYLDLARRAGDYAAERGMNEKVLEHLLADEDTPAAGD